MRGAIAAALLTAALICGALATEASSDAAAEAKQPPNIIVIQTDDQNSPETYQTYTDPLSGRRVPVMPNTLRLLKDGGISFSRYYVSDSLCCPSRTTLLTGRYAHNTGVEGNGPVGGGYPEFVQRSAYNNNLAPWLRRAGYRTIHIGKFLNFYGQQPYSDPTQIPPGWSDWETLVGEDSTHYFYGYTLNDNGALTGPYGDITYATKDDPSCPESAVLGTPCNYQTDVLTQRAVEQIGQSSAIGKPFFLSLDYIAPHGDYQPPSGPEPAPRYYNSLASLPVPRPPGFNEGNVSDKPSFIRSAPRLTPGEIHSIKVEYQKELESLRSVDDGVQKIVSALREAGQLRNTYIVFTSDNGFFQGEHRLQRAKFLAYEPSTHLPLFIRGPGIKRGSRSGELAANTDLAPTILELANAKATASIDGRSLLPFVHDPKLRTDRPILLEGFTSTVDVPTARVGGASASIEAPPENYYAIRVGPYKYVEYADGEKELYDLARDPYELNSERRNPRFYAVKAFLKRRLHLLERCRGEDCRKPIRKPLPQPKPLHPKHHHNHNH
jgi:N-acetylglucosamine-6-sulfatase